MKRYFLYGFSLLMVIVFLVSFNGVLIVEHICLTCHTYETSYFYTNHHHHCFADCDDQCDHHQSDKNENSSGTVCSVESCCHQEATFLQVLPLVTNSDDDTKTAIYAPEFIVVYILNVPEIQIAALQKSYSRLETELKIRITTPTYDYCQCLL